MLTFSIASNSSLFSFLFFNSFFLHILPYITIIIIEVMEKKDFRKMHTVNALKQAKPSQNDSSRDAWLCFALSCVSLCARLILCVGRTKWSIRYANDAYECLATKCILYLHEFQVNDHFVAHFRVNPIPIECIGHFMTIVT